MRRLISLLVAAGALTGVVAFMMPASGGDGDADPIYGITLPAGYREWQLITVAHEEGTLNDIRAILGNDVAITADRDGILPFPDGAIIARVAWGFVPSRKNKNSLRPPPIVRGRTPDKRSSVHGQGLEEIRRDRRLGIRPLQRRQTGECGGAEDLLWLSRGRQSARLRVQPLCALRDRPVTGVILVPPLHLVAAGSET